jgi:predicted transcriptional regulator
MTRLETQSLLSPTEWRVLVAIHRLARAATLDDVLASLPPSRLPLADATFEAVLERLNRRGLIQRTPTLWGPLAARSSFEALFTSQVENFFDTYILDDPIGLKVLGEALGRRLPLSSS